MAPVHARRWAGADCLSAFGAPGRNRQADGRPALGSRFGRVPRRGKRCNLSAEPKPNRQLPGGLVVVNPPLPRSGRPNVPGGLE